MSSVFGRICIARLVALTRILQRSFFRSIMLQCCSRGVRYYPSPCRFTHAHYTLVHDGFPRRTAAKHGRVEIRTAACQLSKHLQVDAAAQYLTLAQQSQNVQSMRYCAKQHLLFYTTLNSNRKTSATRGDLPRGTTVTQRSCPPRNACPRNPCRAIYNESRRRSHN